MEGSLMLGLLKSKPRTQMAENKVGIRMLLCAENFPKEHRDTSHSTLQHWGHVVYENLPDASSVRCCWHYSNVSAV